MKDSRFGKPHSAAAPVAKPLKRPRQARAVFTVEAIYQALVRIWQRQGWDALTTRAVALEAGVAVGTFYDYFPSKQALFSGYVRHSLEQLLERIEQQVIAPPELDWPTRLSRLLRLSCDPTQTDAFLFNLDMWRMEPQIAEAKHQRRAFEDFSATWLRVLQACPDLPQPATAELAEAMLIMAWGGLRYSTLCQLEPERQARWVAQMERAFQALLQAPVATVGA
jgi:AcrR family transcriptional regulator